MAVEPAPGARHPGPQANPTAQQVRGSSLLFLGRILAMGLEFATQVLLVRYLAKAEFGAFSYAISMVLLWKSFTLFGMPDTLARFVPLYREQQEGRKLAGSLALAFGIVLGLSTLGVALIYVATPLLGQRLVDDPVAPRLLLILALSIPFEGLDGLFTTLFAVFGRTRTIFFRQSILAPVLRLTVVAGLIAAGADVVALTTGYLLITIASVSMYAGLFVRLLREQALIVRGPGRQFVYPVRELLGFAVPLLASTVVWLLMESSDALLLGYFQGTEAVANFRAVLPMARLNQLVAVSFATLYAPQAARLYARGEFAELGEFYWQTALWMTVFTFPIFAITCCFARATTAGIYGASYAGSAGIMQLISLGYFFHTALGFNGLTIKIWNKLHYTVAIDLVAALLNLAINFALIPRLGAMGAAWGTAGTMILHNLLKQGGLWGYTGISVLPRRYLQPYSIVVAAAIGLAMLQTVLPPHLWLALPLSGVVTLGVVWGCRDALQIERMFPELGSWPVVGVILRPLIRSS